MTTQTTSMYASAMGTAFDRLDAAVQRFHRLTGEHELHGEVQTLTPVSWLARLLARGLGTPLRASQGPIHFLLSAQPAIETWQRDFPGQRMQSCLRLEGAQLVEVLGLSRLRFELHEVDGVLVMRLLSLHFAGIRCPRWLMPEVVAEESGLIDKADRDDACCLHFKVRASVPWVGLVAGYHGHLMIPSDACRR